MLSTLVTVLLPVPASRSCSMVPTALVAAECVLSEGVVVVEEEEEEEDLSQHGFTS